MRILNPLYRVILNNYQKILRDGSLSKIKGEGEGLSYKHVLLYPCLRSYTPPKGEVKIKFLFFFSSNFALFSFQHLL